MIELKQDSLSFSFPEVHRDATLRIEFQRTLRIPDDDRVHHLPPGLGCFPLRHVDDFCEKVPESWIRHGGIMLPMYQAEALWILFQSDYPFAVKVAAGKINAVTGETWTEGLGRDPQDYVVTPGQPWLDGYCVKKGMVRQFVAMPLGAGYTAEEQITGEAAFGGIQLVAYPLKRDAYELERSKQDRLSHRVVYDHMLEDASPRRIGGMGLAPGGRMRQEIYQDRRELTEWDRSQSSRCFTHLANSAVWRQVTGEEPPTVPPTAKEYSDAGLPWFDYYAEGEAALKGSKILKKLKSVASIGKEKGDVPLPENQPVRPSRVIELRRGLKPGQVRETRF
jgi:hypothetical protein